MKRFLENPEACLEPGSSLIADLIYGWENEVWSAPEWAAKVQRCLNKYKIDSVVLCAKPLRDYGECVWYDPPLDSMPAAFPVVICDGPPGTVKGGGLASCRSWRTG